MLHHYAICYSPFTDFCELAVIAEDLTHVHRVQGIVTPNNKYILDL